jgi:hypothetical protein
MAEHRFPFAKRRVSLNKRRFRSAKRLLSLAGPLLRVANRGGFWRSSGV